MVKTVTELVLHVNLSLLYTVYLGHVHKVLTTLGLSKAHCLLLVHSCKPTKVGVSLVKSLLSFPVLLGTRLRRTYVVRCHCERRLVLHIATLSLGYVRLSID